MSEALENMTFDELQKENRKLEAKVAFMESQISQMQFQIDQMNRLLYGNKG